MALASVVLTRVRHTLLDPGTTYRWTDAELLLWLSDAQRETCIWAPEAHTVTSQLTPDAADVRIDLRVRLAGITPIALLRVAAQQDAKNDVEGAALNPIERHVLDSFDPAWMSYRPATAAYNVAATSVPTYYKGVVYDPKDPLSFWLYPRAHNLFKVWVTYTASPPEVTTTGATLALPDLFIPILHDYVCFRALTKDTVYTGAPGKAAEFAQAFVTKLSALTGKRVALAPTAARAPNEH